MVGNLFELSGHIHKLKTVCGPDTNYYNKTDKPIRQMFIKLSVIIRHIRSTECSSYL
jgi:hypothetical protein